MVSWFKKLFKKHSSDREAFFAEQQAKDTPWACFEIVGFDQDSQVKVEFNWNDAFIDELDRIGFTAETPEDTVQLFFYSSQMQPTDLSGDKTVQSSAHPGLSPNANRE